MEGGWTLPVNDCLVLREVSAPAGYVTRSAPLMVCKGPEGWTTANSKGFTITPPAADFTVTGGQLGDFTVTNDSETWVTTISLTNTAIPKPTPAPTPTPVSPTRGVPAKTSADEADASGGVPVLAACAVATLAAASAWRRRG